MADQFYSSSTTVKTCAALVAARPSVMQGGIASMYFQCVSFCLSLLLFSGLFAFSYAGTASKPEEIISLDRPEISAGQQDQQVIWKLKPTDNGLTSTIVLNLAKPKKIPEIPGKLSGECRVEIDGMIVRQESFTEPDATIEQALPFSTVVDGNHVIALTIRDFEGKLHTPEQKVQTGRKSWDERNQSGQRWGDLRSRIYLLLLWRARDDCRHGGYLPG